MGTLSQLKKAVMDGSDQNTLYKYMKISRANISKTKVLKPIESGPFICIAKQQLSKFIIKVVQGLKDHNQCLHDLCIVKQAYLNN